MAMKIKLIKGDWVIDSNGNKLTEDDGTGFHRLLSCLQDTIVEFTDSEIFQSVLDEVTRDRVRRGSPYLIVETPE